MTRTTRLFGTALGVLLACTAAVWADTYDLSWFTVDDGGATFSTGSGWELGGTIGQPDANVVSMTGGTFELVGGFWVAASPGCRGDFNCVRAWVAVSDEVRLSFLRAGWRADRAPGSGPTARRRT